MDLSQLLQGDPSPLSCFWISIWAEALQLESSHLTPPCWHHLLQC